MTFSRFSQVPLQTTLGNFWIFVFLEGGIFRVVVWLGVLTVPEGNSDEGPQLVAGYGSLSHIWGSVS